MDNPANFEGWALIEMFGHQREAGFVTTQYFGDRAMFQVDVPEIDQKQETLRGPDWVDGQLMPRGTVISREAIPGRSRLINPGAVYAMNPATEEIVRRALVEGVRREIRVVSLPEGINALPGPCTSEEDEDRDDEAVDWSNATV